MSRTLSRRQLLALAATAAVVPKPVGQTVRLADQSGCGRDFFSASDSAPQFVHFELHRIWINPTVAERVQIDAEIRRLYGLGVLG